MDEFMEQFNKRKCFDKIAVTMTGCIGPCNTGPNVLVYPEGIMYGQVTREDVGAIFDEHLFGNQPVERLKVPADIW
jgi:(2Fe-2S) ferredoxin